MEQPLRIGRNDQPAHGRAGRRARVASLAALLLAAALQTACKPAAQEANTQLPSVGVVAVAPQSLPLSLNYSGHTAGSREVEVRARVSGILLARKFEEGRPVAKDQVLFEIDPEPARAALAQAQAELAMQRAQAAQAKRESDRILAMAQQGLVSQLQRDQALSAAEIAEANRLAAEARVRKAELDLGYTQVRAPIAGLASNEARSEGSLITAGAESSLLTRIVQADPLYVEFAVPDVEAATLRAALAKSESTPDAPPIVAHIELADGSRFPELARLTFLDNAVESRSGSVAARAIVKNPDRLLLPGQFVRVRIEGLRMDDVIGVPRKAVLTNGEGHYVWVLGADDTAVQRRVTLGMSVGDHVIVKSGLQEGERVIYEGVMKVAAGKKVNVERPALAGSPGAGAVAAKNAGATLVKSIE